MSAAVSPVTGFSVQPPPALDLRNAADDDDNEGADRQPATTPHDASRERLCATPASDVACKSPVKSPPPEVAMPPATSPNRLTARTVDSALELVASAVAQAPPNASAGELAVAASTSLQPAAIEADESMTVLPPAYGTGAAAGASSLRASAVAGAVTTSSSAGAFSHSGSAASARGGLRLEAVFAPSPGFGLTSAAEDDHNFASPLVVIAGGGRDHQRPGHDQEESDVRSDDEDTPTHLATTGTWDSFGHADAPPSNPNSIATTATPGSCRATTTTFGSLATLGSSVSTAILGKGAYGTVRRETALDGTFFARKTVPIQAGAGCGDAADAAAANAALKAELAVARRVVKLTDNATNPAAPSALVRVHRVCRGHTEATIDMELLDAGPLSRFAPMRDEACVAAVARELLLGLKALHGEVRALHRDIKLQNILASRAGAVKLVDFGSAAVLPDDAPAHAPLVAEDQQGTILQMSPERLRGEPHGPASDVWSVGVTIAELATGRHPFLPAEKGGLASTERFWALAEVIKHTATAEECAAATDAAIAAAVADCGAELRSFVRAAVRAEASERATVEELLAHPFLTSPAALAAELPTVLSQH